MKRETIYTWIYAMSIGELRKELIATLRHAHNKRLPRSKGKDRRGQIPDMLSIRVRPHEIEDHQFPGHWEGGLIKGEGNAGAAVTLVARTDRSGVVVKLPAFKPASTANVLQAFTHKLLGHCVADALEHDVRPRPREGQAQKLSEQTSISSVLLRTAQPRQSALSESMNGLVRHYFPKGTDLSTFSQEQTDVIADQINNRTRKGL